MAWLFIHNVCTLYETLSSIDSQIGTAVRGQKDLQSAHKLICFEEQETDPEGKGLLQLLPRNNFAPDIARDFFYF